MIKLRIQGEEEEIEKFMELVKNLEPFIKILSESDNYPNRNSVYVRKYVDIKSE